MNTRTQPTPKKKNSLFDASSKQKNISKHSCFRFKSWALRMTASPNWFSELLSQPQRLSKVDSHHVLDFVCSLVRRNGYLFISPGKVSTITKMTFKEETQSFLEERK